MKQNERHNEVHHEQLQDLETNCNICALKKMRLCPYLEEVVKCHMFNDLEGQKVFKGTNKEKRQHPRILTSIPAFINKNGSGKEIVPIGSITNISLGGLRVSIPRGMIYKVLTADFEIIFMLPGENEPIHVNCKSRNVVYAKDNIHVGTSIIDADGLSYKALANYLM